MASFQEAARGLGRPFAVPSDGSLAASSDASRGTVHTQHQIIKELGFGLRILGVTLGFLAMVFVWEATNMFIANHFNGLWKQLKAYVGLFVMSILSLVMSHYVTRGFRGGVSTLGSLAYAYATMFVAMSAWGAIITSAKIIFPPEWQLPVLIVCSIAFATGNFVYMTITKHNALLDIASCAVSLGLLDDPESDLTLPLMADVAKSVKDTFSRPPSPMASKEPP